MTITIATYARLGPWLLIFFGTLLVLLTGLFLFSRVRRVRSPLFWIAGVLSAVVLAYLTALLVL